MSEPRVPGAAAPSAPAASVLREWLALAARPSVVRRAMRYAVVVGPILIAINHGLALARGELDAERLAQMAVTVLVPYAVSTFSSVGALREGGAAGRG